MNQIFWEISLKYLLYHMSSEAQVKKILFCRKAIFHSQDIQVFVFLNHLVIYQICDVMISISI